MRFRRPDPRSDRLRMLAPHGGRVALLDVPDGDRLGLRRWHTGESTPVVETSEGPREALERIVRIALQRPPCGVAFSGGRDPLSCSPSRPMSAGVTGFPNRYRSPACSRRCPRRTSVVAGGRRHLGLRAGTRRHPRRVRCRWPDREEASRCPRRAWPPALAGDVPLVEAVPGGSVIDGEGGDEVLGVAVTASHD